jgi:hypothetical protein
MNTGFKELLNDMMTKRWFITAIVLIIFMGIITGIGLGSFYKVEMTPEWKELLFLLLGAFIGSYGKIVDYWFSDTDKDKMLVQKMDEEDGITLSNTADIKDTPKENSGTLVDSTFAIASQRTNSQSVSTTIPQITPQEPIQTKKGVEIDEDGDGKMDGLDFDGDGKIDEYFAHRQCEHVWGDSDHDGHEECLKCGLLKEFNQ